MKHDFRAMKLFLCAGFLALNACSSMNKPEEFTHDGLQLVSTKSFDAVYRKPDVELKHYSRFIVTECSVAFRKNWQRDQNTAKGNTTGRRISDADMQATKEKLGAMCQATFIEALQNHNGYEIVENAGSDVLILKPSIIDLDITAPDNLAPGRSHTYTTSEGSMRLYLEAYDSISGEILGRIVDRSIASSSGQLEWTNSITNAREAKKMLTRWGAALRNMVDNARSE